MVMDNFVVFGRLRETDYKSLVALSLVSRTLGSIALSRLYRRVGWPAYYTLCRRPDLAAFVQWIDVPALGPERICQELERRFQDNASIAMFYRVFDRVPGNEWMPSYVRNPISRPLPCEMLNTSLVRLSHCTEYPSSRGASP
jgi:hypothetical protein